MYVVIYGKTKRIKNTRQKTNKNSRKIKFFVFPMSSTFMVQINVAVEMKLL